MAKTINNTKKFYIGAYLYGDDALFAVYDRDHLAENGIFTLLSVYSPLLNRKIGIRFWDINVIPRGFKMDENKFKVD